LGRGGPRREEWGGGGGARRGGVVGEGGGRVLGGGGGGGGGVEGISGMGWAACRGAPGWPAGKGAFSGKGMRGCGVSMRLAGRTDNRVVRNERERGETGAYQRAHDSPTAQ